MKNENEIDWDHLCKNGVVSVSEYVSNLRLDSYSDFDTVVDTIVKTGNPPPVKSFHPTVQSGHLFKVIYMKQIGKLVVFDMLDLASETPVIFAIHVDNDCWFETF